MLRRLGILFALAALGAVFAVPQAQGAFGIKNWESLTCNANSDTPAVGEAPIAGPPPLPKDPNQCTGATTEKFFTQSAGHPDFGITDFTLNTFTTAGAEGFPEGFVKKIVVDTPEGLSVNPEAAPQCTTVQLEETTCPPASQVGVNYLTVAAQSPPCTVPVAGKCLQARVALPVYNLVPFQGVPSMVGFQTTFKHEVYIVGSLSPVDQHVTFTISDIDPPGAESPPIIGSRLVFNGKAGNGTYLTMPSICAGGQVSKLTVSSQGPPFEATPAATAEQTYETSVGVSGCDKVPFEPTIATTTQGGRVDTPEATTVDVGIPFDASKEISNSYLKTAQVTLPEGMGINPSSANGLESCTDAQFAYHTNTPVSCPAGSKIGTVEVQTPSLPVNSIFGDIYVGQPLKQGPGASSTGEQFRIFIHAFSTRYGVNVRLIGKIFPNPVTGQLTAIVAENPQATFSNFRLHFFGGDKGTLTSPPTCGPNLTTTQLSPWSGQANATPSQSFALTSLPTGGACPTTLASRPFAPGYTAASDNTKAGAYSPFKVRITRPDGQQELKAVNVNLPRGLTANLSGVPYCSSAALDAAANSSGTAQKANSSCPAASQVGTAVVAAGTGGVPFTIAGKAFLAGAYKGAPLSLAIITPAVAGPYDLGTVLVRVALNVNPETAQINAVSDPIPNVFGGVKLDIRRIDVDADRSKFMLNPTNCTAKETAGVINGGGANPATPAAFSSYAVKAAYQASKCNKLAFKPKLNVKLTGPTKRGANPKLRAVLQPGKGDANLSRAALVLPHSLFLDQSHIGTVCTRPQLASQTCPKASIYGRAVANSPLLDDQLRGKVYLVSSDNELPDLLVDLRGQVPIQLRGVIGSKRGGLKTVFNGLPDVPVTKFVLYMAGGKKSLLVNSENTCKGKQQAFLNLKAKNGRKFKNKQLGLNIASCGGKKKK